jgi:hypothetical protein
MPSFVRDLHLYIHTQDGKTSVEAPPDLNAGKFLDDLREPLHLGRRGHLYDREGKKLDPNKSLGENGVGDGHDLYFREEPTVKPEQDRQTPPPPPPEPKVLIRCDNGHYYDPKKYGACPYCHAGGPKR